MNRFLLFLSTNLVEPFKRSFQRFPETVSLALLMMVLVDIQIIVEHGPIARTLGDLVAALWLSLLLSASWVLWRERFPTSLRVRWIGNGLILSVAICYYFLAPTAATMIVEGIRYTGLLLIGGAAFFSAPYFLRKQGFSFYSLHVSTKFLVTAFYSLVLWGGLSLILGTIQALFSVSIDSKVYLLIISTIVGVVTIPVFLGLVPLPDEEFSALTMNKIWKTVFMMIVLPLVLVFTVILLVYVLTALIPNSPYDSMVYMTSALILSAFGILTLFLLDGLSNDFTHVRFYTRWWPYALVVVMLGYYIELIRLIGETGLDIMTSFYVLVGVYPIAVAVVYLLKHPQRLIYTVLMIMDTAFIVTLLPFGNAVAISRYAVNYELNEVLRNNDMWVNNEIVPNPTASLALQNEISYIINRAAQLGIGSLHALPDGFAMDDFEDVFGFPPKDIWIPNDNMVYFNVRMTEEVISLANLQSDYVLFFPQLFAYDDGTVSVTYTKATNSLDVTAPGAVFVIDLETIADDIRTTLNDEFGYQTLTQNQLTFTFNQGGDTIVLVFKEITFSYSSADTSYTDLFANVVVAIDTQP